MPRYAKPALLQEPILGHCAIQASAGTGKTFTLEHLIVDLLLRGIPLEQILVVTFTNKATLELIARVRAMLEKLLALEEDDCKAGDATWLIDDEARSLLHKALMSFDRATISTIHGFCQQVLRDAAFEGARLFQQELVDAGELFERVFTDLVRTRYATQDRALFELALDELGLEKLQTLLRHALKEAGGLIQDDMMAFEAAAEAFPLALAERFIAEAGKGPLSEAFKAADCKPQSFKAMRERLERIVRLRQDCGDAQVFQREILRQHDELAKQSKNFSLPNLQGEALELARAYVALASADSGSAFIATFLPPLQQKLEEIKRAEGLYDFDDMIGLAHEALEGPSGDILAARLRLRYRVALIDEFQDTDQRQWEIFRKLFLTEGDGHQLIVVGDPKQAIYGFRGGDLPTYLQALEALPAPLELDTNYRSTPEVIEAYNEILRSESGALFSGANLAQYGRGVACGKKDLAFVDAEGATLPPIQVVRVEAGKSGPTRWAAARKLALALRDLIGHARFGKGSDLKVIRPEEVFVLTRTGREGRIMLDALRAVGVRAALYRQEGLFDGPEVAACRDLLLAIESPLHESRRAKALLGPFFGFTLREAEGCRELPEHHPILQKLFRWKDLYTKGRYGAFFNGLVSESGVTQRLLFLEEGRRTLTNVGHLLELLQQEALTRHATLIDLAAQLQRWIDGLERPSVEEGEVQRLEQEHGAVQILTMHKSKGLEAPVVALFGGFGGQNPEAAKTEIHLFHDAGTQARRAWIGKLGDAPPEVQSCADLEEREEGERLLYVALTRAKAHLVLPLYSKGEDDIHASSPFDKETGDPKGCYGCVNRRLRELMGGTGEGAVHPRIQVRPEPSAPAECDDPASRLAAWTPQDPPMLELPDFRKLAVEGRPVWSFSYTSMERKSRREREHAHPEEPLDPEFGPESGLESGSSRSGPGGKKFGLQVHAFFQAVDLASFEGATLEAWSASEATQRLADRHLPQENRAEVLAWIHHALAAPLQLPTGGEVRLFQAEKLLRELDFLTPFPGHPDFLNGSIDLLFRHEGKTYFLDWKTNLLAAQREDEDPYRAEAIAQAVESHYRLQVEVYTLAVCRFLGITDRDSYEARYGGAIYVFVRGLPGHGVWSERPDWDTVQSWTRKLEDFAVEALLPVHAGGLVHA